MASALKILFVASEVTPFAKTGGLADVSSSLPKAIKEAGHDIRVFMPKYASVKERKFVLRDVIRLRELHIAHGDKIETIDVKASFLPDTKLQIYFLDFPRYFDRDELYVNPETGVDYTDNAERFSLFCRSALETLKRLHWQPDVIHCNDWQSGLIPVYLKTLYKNDKFFKKTKTFFTIHNLAYQGNFPKEKLKYTNLPENLFYSGSKLEFYQKLSFMKAGIEYSDLISTVSPTYAMEIQESVELGCGFNEILKNRSRLIFGILNGVDYSEWNPQLDDKITSQYDFKTILKKEKNKKQLLKLNELPYNPDIPLIGSISRLADQKGLDLIKQSLDRMMKLNIQYIILGKGEEKYYKFFEEVQQKYPTQVSVHLKFDESLAHLLEAGCDMFLMPSKYEPCGLNQLYSLKYGTIPIVRSTGGLADTVVDYTTNPKEGTGFSFKKYDSNELFMAVQSAVETYKEKTIWREILKRAMNQDFSWQNSSREYIKLYSKIIKKK